MKINETKITSSDGEEFVVQHTDKLDAELVTMLEEATADEIRVLFIKLGFVTVPLLPSLELEQ